MESFSGQTKMFTQETGLTMKYKEKVIMFGVMASHTVANGKKTIRMEKVL
jgi:hypothetical protein